MHQKILIVDDDRLMLSMLRDIFAPEFEVVTADRGDQALAVLEREPVAAILSDHIMQGMTGVEVLQRAIALRPEAVRILVTASDNLQDIRDAVNVARVHRVVAKPVHPVEILGIVNGALHERELTDENARLVKELSRALAEIKAREAELERELNVRTAELKDVLDQLRRVRPAG